MTASGAVLARRYRLDGRISVGGVGEVWRGSDTALNRPVAVKLLKDEYSQHPEAVARFRAEARHAASLSHPAVARVYDYCEADGGSPSYLVMELVDGPSLAEVLAKGPLDPARSMDIVAQTAAGLAAAHAAGLIHRDIKPANLLLSSTGQVKITDFGIAHAAGTAPLTRTGTLVGTPAYLAPERVAGASGTAAADLYALGVVGYECLAGSPPFSGDPLEVAAAQLDRPLPPLPAGIPAEVAALVAALTMKDPAARPGSAGEVAWRAGRLRDALAGHDPLTGSGTAMPSVAEPSVAESLGLLSAEPEHYQPVAGVIARPGRTGHGSRWPIWSVAVAVMAAALLAGLAGWRLAGVAGPVHGSASPAAAPAPSSSPASHHPASAHAPASRKARRGGDSLVRKPAAARTEPRHQHGRQARGTHSRQPHKPPHGTRKHSGHPRGPSSPMGRPGGGHTRGHAGGGPAGDAHAGGGNAGGPSGGGPAGDGLSSGGHARRGPAGGGHASGG